jgi:Ca-activated chloride channel family protein
MNLIEALSFDILLHPTWLFLLVGVGALLIAELSAAAPGALSISTGETLARIPQSRASLLRRIPAILRAIGLALLVIALAGPLHGLEIRKDRADVIDIMLCVDVSGSMAQKDFFAEGKSRDRLYMTKIAVQDFVESRKDRTEDRYGYDRLGLILYAGFARTQVPLTLDYEIFERELDAAKITTEARKDGTAIGSAIGLAVQRLSHSDAKSKVVILLTDGLNNAGDLDPISAAQVAKKYGMRVYTIGAGSTSSGGGGFFGTRTQPIDEATLKEIADITEARYYRATDTESLEEAYAEINALETTEIEIGDYYEYKDAFMPFAVWGTVALLVSMFTRRRWFEVIP